MPLKIKVSGAWKDANPKVKVGGAWKQVSQMYVKVAGVWKALLELFIVYPNRIIRVSDNNSTIDPTPAYTVYDGDTGLTQISNSFESIGTDRVINISSSLRVSETDIVCFVSPAGQKTLTTGQFIRFNINTGAIVDESPDFDTTSDGISFGFFLDLLALKGVNKYFYGDHAGYIIENPDNLATTVLTPVTFPGSYCVGGDSNYFYTASTGAIYKSNYSGTQVGSVSLGLSANIKVVAFDYARNAIFVAQNKSADILRLVRVDVASMTVSQAVEVSVADDLGSTSVSYQSQTRDCIVVGSLRDDTTGNFNIVVANKDDLSNYFLGEPPSLSWSDQVFISSTSEDEIMISSPNQTTQRVYSIPQGLVTPVYQYSISDSSTDNFSMKFISFTAESKLAPGGA